MMLGDGLLRTGLGTRRKSSQRVRLEVLPWPGLLFHAPVCFPQLTLPRLGTLPERAREAALEAEEDAAAAAAAGAGAGDGVPELLLRTVKRGRGDVGSAVAALVEGTTRETEPQGGGGAAAAGSDSSEDNSSGSSSSSGGAHIRRHVLALQAHLRIFCLQ